jgi:hypothetical protein
LVGFEDGILKAGKSGKKWDLKVGIKWDLKTE